LPHRSTANGAAEPPVVLPAEPIILTHARVALLVQTPTNPALSHRSAANGAAEPPVVLPAQPTVTPLAGHTVNVWGNKLVIVGGHVKVGLCTSLWVGLCISLWAGHCISLWAAT